MNKAALKSYATQARKDAIAAVTARAILQSGNPACEQGEKGATL